MSRARPDFSVVIPTHQRNTLVVAAVNSVLAQTYPAYEILVVSDGPNPDLGPILEWHFSDAPVRLIEIPNQGVSAARNAGIDNASSHWVSFLDDDDLWHPAHLDQTANYLRGHCEVSAVHGPPFRFSSAPGAHGIDFVATDLESCLAASADFSMNHTSPFAADIAGRSFSMLLERAWCLPSTMTVARHVLMEAGQFPVGIRSGQDWILSLEVARIVEWHLLPRRTVFYRVHASSLTGTKTAIGPLKRIELIRSIWQGIDERGAPPHLPRSSYGAEYRKVVRDAIWTSIRRREFRLAWKSLRSGTAILPRWTDRLACLMPPPITHRLSVARRRLGIRAQPCEGR